MSDATAASKRPIETLTDALGRKLALQELNVLEQAKLLRAVGPAQSGNETYYHLVECAAMVRSIDDLPCPFPGNERLIDAAISRLDDEGMAAVMVLRSARIMATMRQAEQIVEAGGAAPDPLAQSAL